MFTKQLYRTKKRALDRYHKKAIDYAIAFERKWLRPRATDKHDTAGEADLGLNNLTAVYAHVHKMRVVPFDLRVIFGTDHANSRVLVSSDFSYLGIPEPSLKMLEGLYKTLTH